MSETPDELTTKVTSIVENDRAVSDLGGDLIDTKGIINKWCDENRSDPPNPVKWEINVHFEICGQRRSDRPDRQESYLRSKFSGRPDVLEEMLADTAAIEYIKNRFDQTANPVRKARCAEFLWEAARCKKLADGHKFARAAITASLDQCDLCIEQAEWNMLEAILDRAAEIAIRLNDGQALGLVCEKIHQCVERVDASTQMTLIYNLWDTLKFISDGRAGVDTTKLWRRFKTAALESIRREEQKAMRQPFIITRMLEICVSAGEYGVDPAEKWTYQVRQAEFLEDEAMRREKEGPPRGGPLIALKFMEDAYREYLRLASLAPPAEKGRMQAKAAETALAFRRLVREAPKQMTPISHSEPFPADEYDKYLIEPIVAEPDKAKAMFMLACHPWLIPRVKNIEANADKMRGKFLFTMIPTMRFKGSKKIDETSPAEGEDEASKFTKGYEYSGNEVSIHYAVHQLKEKNVITKETLLTHFKGWELMHEESIPFLEKGLGEYFEGDWISAIHILVPRFEQMFRNALEMLGVNVAAAPDDRRVLEMIGFSSFLSSEDAKINLGEDFCGFVNHTFFDSTGIGLRHDVAHGWLTAEDCTAARADLVIFALLQLTRIRRPPKEES